jgi:hypothetical protein
MQVAAAPRCATGNHMGFEHRALEREGHRLQELIDGESGYRILVGIQAVPPNDTLTRRFSMRFS